MVRALSQPMTWKHKTNTEIIYIEANTVRLVIDLKQIFVKFLPEAPEKQKLINMPTTNFTSAVSKVLKNKLKTAHQFAICISKKLKILLLL